jgi:hypothetical protein
LPGFQFLPAAAQRRLAPLGAEAAGYEPVRLLDADALGRLFPDAEIVRERIGPLTKSLIAVGPR